MTKCYVSSNLQYFKGGPFQNYFGNGYDGASVVIQHDDHYVQYGSLARIELTNSATWGQETASEVQTPVSWADGIVVRNLNLGAFTSVSGLYLHRIGHDGSAVRIGQFT
jgi:hypothetical protein